MLEKAVSCKGTKNAYPAPWGYPLQAMRALMVLELVAAGITTRFLGGIYVLFLDGRDGLATVFLGFDLQGWITLLAGALLALITLFTGYSHVDFFWGTTLPLNQQVGVSLLLASLATLALEAQLASRRRSRDQIDRAEEAEAAARERDLTDRERERAARRAQRQAQCNLVQLRHQLEPIEPNAQRIRDVISLLEEYGDSD